MKLRLLLFVTFAISINNLVHAQEQTFKLKDGTVIVGTVQEETDLTMQVETKFGIVTINKSALLLTQYEVKLKTGETLIGFITGEYTDSIILKTQIGELTIQRSDIINIQEESQQKPTSAGNTQEQYRRPYGLTDFLFSGSKIDKDTDFALGEEQLIDLFFDATGYTKRIKFFIAASQNFIGVGLVSYVPDNSVNVEIKIFQQCYCDFYSTKGRSKMASTLAGDFDDTLTAFFGQLS